MLTSRLAWALPLLLALTPAAQAQIYKYIDKNGNLVLTDEAVPGAKKIEAGPTMTIPALDKSRMPAAPKAPKAVPADYTITIESPANDSIFQRQAEDVVPIGVSVSPNLQAGHRLVVLLDGSPHEGGAIPAAQLERGAHTLSTQVLDIQGQVLKQGPSVTFHVQQPSLQSPTRR